MPALVPAIGAAVTFFSTPLGSLVLLGVISGISALTAPKADEGAAASSSGAQLSLQRGEDTPVDAVVGRFATGGQLAFHYEVGEDNEYLNLVVVLGTGLHDSLNRLFVDGSAVTLAGSNSDTYGRHVTSSDYLDADGDPLIWVKFFNGSMSQTADATMVAEVDDADRWGTAHKLTGHAWAWVRIKYDEEVFGGSDPQFVFEVKGLRLYDWRKDSTVAGGSGPHRWGTPSTYEWTENPAVVLYNYRRGIYCGTLRVLGIGCGALDNDLAKFTAAANLSDEEVEYPDTGKTLPRYTVGMTIRDDEDPQTITRTLEAAMGGYGAAPGGVYGPLPAASGSPVLTITDDDLQLGYPRTLQTHLDPAASWTCVQGQFSDPDKGWQLAPYATSKDTAVDAAQGGRRTLPLDLGFVNAYETASMLAEIERRRNLFGKQESGVFRPKFIRLQTGDIVSRVTPLFGTVSMMVMSTKELEDGSVSLSLREWHNSIVPDSGEDYVPAPTPAGPAPPAPTLLLTVPGFGVTSLSLSDGVAAQPAFKATWTAITDQTVDSVVIRYYPTALGLSDAQYVSVPRGSTTSAVITGLAPNTEYVVQAKLETTPSRPGLAYTTAIVLNSGGLTAVAAPSSVDWEALASEVQSNLRWIANGVRAAMDSLDEFGTILSAADLDQFNQREQLRRELSVQLGTLEAGFTEVIEVAIGPGGAIATALESLYAALGGNTSSVNVRWQAVAAPSGYSARYAVQAAVDDGVFRAATFMLDVPANPLSKTRIVLDAGETVISTDGGTTVTALFNEDGAIIRDITTGLIHSEDNLSFWNLATGAFRIAVA